MPISSRPIFWLSALPTAAFYAPLACATHYLDIDEAQRLIFPQAQVFTELAPPEKDTVRLWQVSAKGSLIGYFFVDNVVGKHEYITYGLGLSASGAVQQIEILDYRETKGGQIRNQYWRDQFKSKTSTDALEVGVDITNISGATLSCKHVTEGVRRLLAFYRDNLQTSP